MSERLWKTVFEEYLDRNDIKVPHVRASSTDCCFFCKTNTKVKLPSGREYTRPVNEKWLILNSSWKRDSHHPGNYVLRLLKPNYNALLNGRDFFVTWREEEVSYDKYEKYVIDCVTTIGGENHNFIPTTEIEVVRVAIEMFVYCAESEILRIPGLIDVVYEILDDEKTQEERSALHRLFLMQIRNNNKGLLNHWEKVFGQYIDKYGYHIHYAVKNQLQTV